MAESDDDSAEHKEKLLKIVLVGDGSSGKTSLASRYAQDEFGRQYNQTIGVDFFLKRITLPDNLDVTLQVWDIGGQTIGGAMLSQYLYNCDIVLLVYDITNANSFKNLEDWCSVVVQKTSQQPTKPYVALVGNKMDLCHMRTVDKNSHEKFIDEHELSKSRFFVSAKSGDSVNYLFKKVTADVLNVRLSHGDVDMEKKVIKAEIVLQQSDTLRPSIPPAKSTACIIT